MLLRIIIISLIVGAIAWGARKIWRDWTRNFREVDAEKRQRDLKERVRPDVITLKRDKDGTFRPPDDDMRR